MSIDKGEMRMSLLQAQDTISGREGRAYAKIDGNNEEMFYAKSIEATVQKHKKQVKAIGRRMVGHKTMGGEGTGRLSLYYLSPLFRSKISQWKRTGEDTYFDLVVENADPTSDAGTQRVLLSGVNLDATLLTKLDGERDAPLEESVDFTFEDFEILQAFEHI